LQYRASYESMEQRGRDLDYSAAASNLQPRKSSFGSIFGDEIDSDGDLPSGEDGDSGGTGENCYQNGQSMSIYGYGLKVVANWLSYI